MPLSVKNVKRIPIKKCVRCLLGVRMSYIIWNRLYLLGRKNIFLHSYENVIENAIIYRGGYGLVVIILECFSNLLNSNPVDVQILFF